MPYQLKKGVESFEVVDGAFAGKKFLRGRVYAAIPPEEKNKFKKLESREAGKPGGREASKSPSIQASKSAKPEVKS